MPTEGNTNLRPPVVVTKKWVLANPKTNCKLTCNLKVPPIEACINEPVCFTYEMSIPSEDIGVYYDFYTTLLDHGTLEFYPNFLQYLNGYVHKSGLICFTPYEGVTGNYSTPFTVQIKSENGAILGELQDQPLCH